MLRLSQRITENPMFDYKPPYNVVCPKCRAARGGRCLEPVKDGSKFIEEPHEERVELASKEAA
jgi:hypothetical protein